MDKKKPTDTRAEDQVSLPSVLKAADNLSESTVEQDVSRRGIVDVSPDDFEYHDPQPEQLYHVTYSSANPTTRHSSAAPTVRHSSANPTTRRSSASPTTRHSSERRGGN